jgi:hypothetical protein
LDCRKYQSPSTAGHLIVTARSTPRDHRCIRAKSGRASPGIGSTPQRITPDHWSSASAFRDPIPHDGGQHRFPGPVHVTTLPLERSRFPNRARLEAKAVRPPGSVVETTVAERGSMRYTFQGGGPCDGALNGAVMPDPCSSGSAGPSLTPWSTSAWSIQRRRHDSLIPRSRAIWRRGGGPPPPPAPHPRNSTA